MAHNLDLRRFAGDASINLLRITLMTAAGIGISIVLARGLGEVGKGNYELAILLPTLLHTLFNIGIQQGTIYLVGSGRYTVFEAARGNLTLTLWLTIVAVSIGVAIVLLGNQVVFPGVPSHLLLVSLLLLPLFYARFGLSAVFQGGQNFRLFSTLELIPYFFHLVLMLAGMWWFEDRVLIAIESLIWANFISIAYGVQAINRKLKREYQKAQPLLSLTIDSNYRHDLMEYGFKTQFGLIMLFLLFRVDLFLLNQAGQGAASVGIYSVAIQLAERIWVFTGFAGQVMMPRIAAWVNEDERRTELTVLTMRFTFWLSLILLVLVLVFGGWLISLLFGEAFVEAVIPLYLIMPGIVMYNFSRVLGADFSARGRPQINSVLFTLALVVNVGANLILIPRFDYVGAALASSLSYSALGGASILIFCNINRVAVWKMFIPTHEDFQRILQAGHWLSMHIYPAKEKPK
jgi:O-antigen/teichoic acid export membrane protein